MAVATIAIVAVELRKRCLECRYDRSKSFSLGHVTDVDALNERVRQEVHTFSEHEHPTQWTKRIVALPEEN